MDLFSNLDLLANSVLQDRHKILSPEEWLADSYYSGPLAYELWDNVKYDVCRVINQKPNFCIITGGLGTGKSRTCEAIIAYYIYWLKSHASCPKALGLPESTTVTMAIMNYKYDKAKKTSFRRLSQTIRSIPWFRQNAPPNERQKNALEWNDLLIMPYPATAQSVISEDLFACFFDECNFWDHSSEADKIDDVFKTARDRMRSRFKDNWLILAASSGVNPDDFTERHRLDADIYIPRVPWNKAEEEGPCILVDIGDRVNPPRIIREGDEGKRIVRIPARLSQKMDEEGLVFFLQNTYGIGVSDKQSLYGSWIFHYPYRPPPANVEEGYLIAAGEPLPTIELVKTADPEAGIDERPRFLHIDLATVGCWCGISCGYIISTDWESYKEDYQELVPRIYVDFCIRVHAKEAQEELQISSVVEFLLNIAKQVPVKSISWDGHQSTFARQVLETKGINSPLVSVDRTPEPHQYLKRLFHEKKIDIYMSDILIKELKSLYADASGKIRIPSEKRHSKDVADSLAGMVFNCYQNIKGKPTQLNKPMELECTLI